MGRERGGFPVPRLKMLLVVLERGVMPKFPEDAIISAVRNTRRLADGPGGSVSRLETAIVAIGDRTDWREWHVSDGGRGHEADPLEWSRWKLISVIRRHMHYVL